MYYCCGITDKGVMKHNEDAYMISDRVLTEGNIDVMLSPPFLAAVSDGVSGSLVESSLKSEAKRS